MSRLINCIAKTVQLCNDNDTIEIVGHLPEEFEQWRKDLKKEEHFPDGAREKRSDVEAPGD